MTRIEQVSIYVTSILINFCQSDWFLHILSVESDEVPELLEAGYSLSPETEEWEIVTRVSVDINGTFLLKSFFVIGWLSCLDAFLHYPLKQLPSTMASFIFLWEPKCVIQSSSHAMTWVYKYLKSVLEVLFLTCMLL